MWNNCRILQVGILLSLFGPPCHRPENQVSTLPWRTKRLISYCIFTFGLHYNICNLKHSVPCVIVLDTFKFYHYYLHSILCSACIHTIRCLMPTLHLVIRLLPFFAGFSLVPSIMCDKGLEVSMADISEYAAKHLNDLPSPETLKQELRIWYAKYTRAANRPDQLLDTYKEAEGNINFPNVMYLVKTMLTIPATSATTERANSTLKFVKTRLRSTLSQVSLNALVLGYKHKDILQKLQLEAILDNFISSKRRRLLLLNPIAEWIIVVIIVINHYSHKI